MTTPPLLPLNDGQITIGDLYRVMSAIQQDLREVLVKFEGVTTVQNADHERIDDHETRIRSNESTLVKLATTVKVYSGIAVVVSGAVAAILSNWLHH